MEGRIGLRVRIKENDLTLEPRRLTALLPYSRLCVVRLWFSEPSCETKKVVYCPKKFMRNLEFLETEVFEEF